MHPTNQYAGLRSRRGGPAWELALLFPLQGQWTEAEYLALDGSHLIELSDGCLEVLPMPNLLHQRVLCDLLKILEDFASTHQLGHVLMAPLPLRLWEGKYREPDILLFRPEHCPDRHRYPTGADLVVEVVGEGIECRKRDYEVKRIDYAQARIAEYWIVDPELQQITVLTLDGQTYREHGVFGKSRQASSVLLPGFTVDVDAVFAAGQNAAR